MSFLRLRDVNAFLQDFAVTTLMSFRLFLNLVPRAFSSFKIVDRRSPWPRLSKWLQKFVRISSRKHAKMSSFCLHNDFRLQKKNRAARRWKHPPKKPFHHVSRDKVLHYPWSISAAFSRGLFGPPF